MQGLYTEAGSPTVYYVNGFVKTPIFDQQSLIAQFGPDAPTRVQTLPAGSLAPLELSGGGIFGRIFDALGVQGGGTITFGNQAVQGNLWAWLIAGAAVLYFLTRGR